MAQLPFNCDIVGFLKLLVDEGLCYCLRPARHEKKLKWKMEELKRTRVATDRMMQMQITNQPRMAPKPEVEAWMKSVDSVDAEVSDLMDSLAHNRCCMSFLLCSCKSNHELGENVAGMLERVQQLRNEKETLGETLVLPRADLEADIKALEREIDSLKAHKEGLIKQVGSLEAQPSAKRTPVVENWIKQARLIEEKFGKLQLVLGDAPSGDALNEKVTDLLRDVREQIRQRNELGDSLVYIELPEPVEVADVGFIAGGETMLDQIQRHVLNNDDVGVIGIWGMGGIGKTTLLQRVNNSFANDTMGFDMVIWVTVSKDLSTSLIRATIAKRLGLTESNHSASDIRHALSKKRFLLLLDDLWEKVHLADLGVPLPSRENRCKIVLTTRSKEVCRGMDAKAICKVEFLNEEESLRLFTEKLGSDEIVSDPTLKPLMKQVVRRCGGHPLALITVARAMADAKREELWEAAIDNLKESPADVRGMEANVLSALKYSFDKLRDDSARECLLFCALFPEDKEIEVNSLVDYWIGEGILETSSSIRPRKDIRRARTQGLEMIETLKKACFLEDGLTPDLNYEDFYNRRESVKLHDVVRDMALWIIDGKHTIVAGVSPERATSEEAERMFVPAGISKEAKQLELHNYPKLRTLIAGMNQYKRPSNFLCFANAMPSLRVLDLSWTDFTMGKDLELICEFSELQYLNLTGARIKSLPRRFGRLTKLRQLILDGAEIEEIAREAITGLASLESISACKAPYGGNIELKDLEGLERLVDIDLHIRSSWESLQVFRKSRKLMQHSSQLRLSGGIPLSAITDDFFENDMCQLKCFSIINLNKLETIVFSRSQFPNLRKLELYSAISLTSISFQSHGPPPLERLSILRIAFCLLLEDINWARRLPKLEEVSIHYCGKMVTLFGSGEETDLPQLKYLRCGFMESLQSISDQTLLLPSLRVLSVNRCTTLRKLPLGPQSAESLKIISIDRFADLKWESRELWSKFGHDARHVYDEFVVTTD